MRNVVDVVIKNKNIHHQQSKDASFDTNNCDNSDSEIEMNIVTNVATTLAALKLRSNKRTSSIKEHITAEGE